MNYTRTTNSKREVKDIVAVLYVILLISVYTDMTKGMIPNWLIAVGCVIGFITAQQRFEKLVLVIIVFIVLFPFFAAGVLGAGDVKCLCMIGLYLERNPFITSILSGFFVAALISFYILLKDFILNKSKAIEQVHTIHLAGPIFIGVLISTGGTYL